MPKILKRVPEALPGEAKASDHWRTPKPLFAALDAEFRFHYDLAADTENHLCDVWLGDGGIVPDALTCDWGIMLGHGPGFLNPPYSSALIRPFLAKCALEATLGFTTVALVPYTPDTKWWEFVLQAVEIREIPHRVPYLRADGITKAGAMFPSAIAVFRPQPGVLRRGLAPRRVVWSWKPLEAA